MRLLQTTLAAHPTDLDVRLALADIYARNHQEDQAEQEFQQALRLHPESSSAALALAAFYIAHGRLAAAEQLLEETLRQHPTLTEAHRQLALVLAQQHKYREARANITLVPAPADPDARVRYFRLIASIDSGLGDSHAAAHAIEKPCTWLPGTKNCNLSRQLPKTEAGEWTACIRNIEPLYKKHPNPRNGLVLLRAELASHTDFAPTLESFRTLKLPADQEFELRVHAAELLASADRHREAVDQLQQALKLEGPGRRNTAL